MSFQGKVCLANHKVISIITKTSYYYILMLQIIRLRYRKKVKLLSWNHDLSWSERIIANVKSFVQNKINVFEAILNIF